MTTIIICDGGRFTWIPRTGKVRSVRMRGRMRAEELVMEGHRTAVAEFELVRAEVRETGRRPIFAAESTRVQVQREPAHLARAPEERVPAHRRQLFQPTLLAPLVLEPDLKPENKQTDLFNR